jgi:hypothetical protein
MLSVVELTSTTDEDGANGNPEFIILSNGESTEPSRLKLVTFT